MNVGLEAVIAVLVIAAIVIGGLWLLIRSAVASANKRRRD